MAPFSLITLGITYTIGVVGLASSSMQDGVTSLTEFSHPFPPGSGCDNLIFTVTPHNEAGEGIPNSIPLSQAIERETRTHDIQRFFHFFVQVWRKF